MKSLYTIVFAFMLASTAFSQILDFKFYDANGRGYNSTTFNKEINSSDNIGLDECIILIETPSLIDSQYFQQNKILDLLDAESLQLIYIT
ncbi:MAG: hypothetical protein MUC31_04120, partial [Bacteroidales bacterium]|nr:hypothetical protein [Bacteroidales bacterium]